MFDAMLNAPLLGRQYPSDSRCQNEFPTQKLFTDQSRPGRQTGFLNGLHEPRLYETGRPVKEETLWRGLGTFPTHAKAPRREGLEHLRLS